MKVPTSECVPSIALAQPGPVTKLARKKNKKRFWKKKAQGGSRRPGSDPRVVAERPPKAPEDFSQNWKALQEVRPEGPGGRLHQPGILVGWPQDAKEKGRANGPKTPVEADLSQNFSEPFTGKAACRGEVGVLVASK
jgi:RNA exonuclease 4